MAALVSFLQQLFLDGPGAFRDLPARVPPAAALVLMVLMFVHDVLLAWTDVTLGPGLHTACQATYRNLLLMVMASVMTADIPDFTEAFQATWQNLRKQLCTGRQPLKQRHEVWPLRF
jgi:hypothetical protein